MARPRPHDVKTRLLRRARRAGVALHWARLEWAVDRMLAQGDDPLASRAEDPYRYEEYGPYVCPDCFAVGAAAHAPGCDEAAREIEREDDRDRCSRCGDVECDCDHDHAGDYP